MNILLLKGLMHSFYMPTSTFNINIDLSVYLSAIEGMNQGCYYSNLI